MEAYVLTQMELVGEGEQSHVVTRNKGVTFDPEKAAAWARKGVDYDYDTLPFSEDEAINAGATVQLVNGIAEVRDAAKIFGEVTDEARNAIVGFKQAKDQAERIISEIEGQQ